MTTDNNTKPKFADESTGLDALKYLDCTPAPVYYGFNCTPRQIRYYGIDKSVESIQQGRYTRSSVEKYLEKVKQNMCKAEQKYAEYEDKVKALNDKINACTESQTRHLLRKEAGRIETRMCNYEYDTVSRYQRAFEAVRRYLAE